MEHIIFLFTLNTESSDPWSLILGPLGALFISIIANVYQARDLKSERENNRKLNEIMRQDSKESMQILASMDKMLGTMISKLGDGETRITQTIKDSAQDVKDHVDVLMDKIKNRSAKT